jgi:hypothetical protein
MEFVGVHLETNPYESLAEPEERNNWSIMWIESEAVENVEVRKGKSVGVNADHVSLVSLFMGWGYRASKKQLVEGQRLRRRRNSWWRSSDSRRPRSSAWKSAANQGVEEAVSGGAQRLRRRGSSEWWRSSNSRH